MEKWQKFDTKKQAESYGEFHRVRIIDWEGSGWYFIKTYTKPCPRGCCNDSVIEFTSAKIRINEISEEMKELAQELKVAKEYANSTKITRD